MLFLSFLKLSLQVPDNSFKIESDPSGIYPTSSLLVMRQFGHRVKVATLHITNLY